MEKEIFSMKKFIVVTLITSIWIHIGEIFRAVVVAFPMIKAFFGDKIEVGPMGLSNALIWGLWDIILTAVLVFILWLCIQSFGRTFKSIIISSTVTAFATLGIFWIATVNTGLGEWRTAFIIFPIAWVEMIIGAAIASWLYGRNK